MKNKKNIIFFVQHLSGLYQALAFKFDELNNDNVTLIINQKEFGKSNFSKNLIKNGVFSKILCFAEGSAKGKNGQENKINEFYDKILYDNEINLNEIDEIISVCDVQNLFAIYCMSHGKKVDFIELTENQFADKNRYHINTIYINAPAWLEELSLKYEALCGSPQFSNHRYLWPNSKIEYPKIDSRVDFIKKFFSIDKKYKQLIVDCLEIKDHSIFNNFNLVLFNSDGWIMPKVNLKSPYYYLPFLFISDYYFKEGSNIVVKDHPQVKKDDFNKYVSPYVKSIESQIPIEIFALIDGFHINSIVSINSTGNDKVAKFVDKQIKLGENYCYEFRNLHKAFITFSIDEKLEKSNNYHYFGVDREFLLNFKNLAFTPFEGENPRGMNPKILRGNIFAIIGNANQNLNDFSTALMCADPQTKAIFWNIDLEKFTTFENIDLLDCFVRIVIHKKKLRETCLSDEEDEYIYFFCKDENIRKQVQGLKFEKELKVSGLQIFAEFYEDLEFKVLKEKIKNNLLVSQVKYQKNIIDSLKNVLNKGENK